MTLKLTSLAVISLALVLAACGKPDSPAGSDQPTVPAGSDQPTVPIAATPAPTAEPQVTNPVESLSRNLAIDQVPGIAGVGEVVDGALAGTGKGGFLMYGPYVPFQAGTYIVSIKGSTESLPEGKNVRLDVVSGRGKVSHGSTVFNQVGELPSFEAIVPEDVADLEVRAQVPEGSKVVIQSYAIARKL